MQDPERGRGHRIAGTIARRRRLVLVLLHADAVKATANMTAGPVHYLIGAFLAPPGVDTASKASVRMACRS